jgi:Molecular chaperone
MKNASPARACGIDFGTSNSTVGWLRPGMETLIALEDDKITLPSVVFFNMEERRPVYGRLALHEYLEGYEGRLMRSLKSLLGSKLIKHDTSVLGTAMPFKDLLGLFIGQLKKRAETAAGREFDEVVLGRPVFSSMTMNWPTRKPKTPWWTWPAPSASRMFRSSTNRLRRPSTMSRPSKKKSWC